MWGNAAAPPVRSSSGLRIGGVVLLVLAAALALGGSFGAMTYYEYGYTSSGSTTTSTTVTTGWQVVEDPVNTEYPPTQPLDGVMLVVGAVLAMAAVGVLVTSGRRPGRHVWGRTAGVGAAALLVGGIGDLWLSLLSNAIAIGRQVAADPSGSGTHIVYTFGAGAWLVLLALVCALAAAIVLLLSARADRPAYQPIFFHPAGPVDHP